MKENCPVCEGSGWETIEDPKTGDPMPSQCEFCEGTGNVEVEANEDEDVQRRYKPFI